MRNPHRNGVAARRKSMIVSTILLGSESSDEGLRRTRAGAEPQQRPGDRQPLFIAARHLRPLRTIRVSNRARRAPQAWHAPCAATEHRSPSGGIDEQQVLANRAVKSCVSWVTKPMRGAQPRGHRSPAIWCREAAGARLIQAATVDERGLARPTADEGDRLSPAGCRKRGRSTPARSKTGAGSRLLEGESLQVAQARVGAALLRDRRSAGRRQ